MVDLRRRVRWTLLAWTWTLTLATCTTGWADVRLHPLFADHALLQRDRPLPVWGVADPGEQVTVALGAASATTVADADGKWSVTLDPQPASTEPLTLRVAGRNELTVRDVLLGDVWLCGGQSNMEWPLGACQAPEDVATADFPLLRAFRVEHDFASAPQTAPRGQWTVVTPQTAGNLTAVGYYFARRIHQETGVPIGILQSCVGGTNIELWLSEQTLMNTPALDRYAAVMRNSLEQWRTELAEQLPAVDRWSATVREALRDGGPIAPPPPFPEYPFGERRFRPRCVTLHNGMIAPLVPLAVRGCVWYQGESNAGSAQDAADYVAKKQALVADWRRYFGGDQPLPFYFVQLASWQAAEDDPAGGGPWPLLREAQRRCLQEIPGTGMAVAIDVGDAGDIHPANKFDVGERLARWALVDVYDRDLTPSGPLFKSLRIEGDRALVSFDHVGEGLMAGRKTGRAPVVATPDEPLRRFAIAGEDRQWRWADARIEGETVVCTHPEVARPAAVRYALHINPEGANLYNRDGLPAAPFRTDDW